jgi:hypothetical protein
VSVLWLLAALASVVVPASAGRSTARADDSLIPDATLGVTWLDDANLASHDTFDVKGINKDGSMDFQTAVKWVRAMNHAKFDGHSNWMLPTTPTSQSGCQSHKKNGAFGFGCNLSAFPWLYSKTFGLTSPDTAVPITDGDVGPFQNFQPYLYWTSSQGTKSSQGYKTFSFNTGWSGSNVPIHDMYVLPLLDGNPFGIAGHGDGLFPGDGGAVVWEPSADVTWLADADLAKADTFGLKGIDVDGSMDETTAGDFVDGMNAGKGYLGKTDWKLPTDTSTCGGFDCRRDNPLGELFYEGLGHVQGQPVVGVPSAGPAGFENLQPYIYWSCESQTARARCTEPSPVAGQAWSFSFGHGFLGTDIVQNNLYVMVYFPTFGAVPSKPHPGCKPGTPGSCK